MRASRSARRSSVWLASLAAVFTLAIHSAPAFALCPDGIVDPDEQCDDGGFCIGGPLAGAACTSEEDCIDGGACFGGLDDLRACVSDSDCRSGSCRRCRPVGGDGCAANCTFETEILARLVPGIVEPSGDTIRFGTSGGAIFGPFLTVPIPLIGTVTLTVGHSVDGESPVAIKTSNVRLPAFPVGTLACGCLRGPTQFTCGGTILDADATLSTDCTPGSAATVECPAEKPCAPVHGGGNAGSGRIGCGERGVGVEVTHDCLGTPGELPLPALMSAGETDEPSAPAKGQALFGFTLSIGTVVGGCTGFGRDHGPDGLFCTDDDPVFSRGAAIGFFLTTGSASGRIDNPGNIEGDVLGPFSIVGRGFTCNDSDGSVDISGGVLSGVFTACDQPTVSDIVAPMSFGFGDVPPLPGRIGPEVTPGPNDCCQCFEPLACVVPAQGDCGECSRVPNAICGEDAICRDITPSPTTTPTRSPTPSPGSPSPSPTRCPGDCDGHGGVVVSELVTLVGVALGLQPIGLCTAGDVDRNGVVTVDEILAAIRSALNGCGSATTSRHTRLRDPASARASRTLL